MNASPDAVSGETLVRPPPSAIFTGADRKFGAPSGTWLYEDQDGRLFYQCRYEKEPDETASEPGGKTYRPWIWGQDRKGEWTWISRGPAHPTPLYHLSLLQQRADATVYVVEGEKCADALQALLSEAGRPGVVVSAWGGAGSMKHGRWEALAGRRCILWPDNDDVGRHSMAWVAQRLFSLRAKVAVVDVPRGTLPDHWDVADGIASGWTLDQIKAFVTENLREVATAPAVVVEMSEARKAAKSKPVPKPAQAPSSDAQDEQTDMWRHWNLDCRNTGIPWENTENVCRVLAKLHEGENFGKIWYDEFAQRIVTAGKRGPRAWEDADTISLQCFLQANLGMKRINKHLVHDGVVRHARSHTVNPVRDWLESLKWDGTERLHTMLSRGWGTKQTDYTAAVGRCFLMGAAQRILKPGSKVDNVPVFEGDEGNFKTQALEILAGSEWYDCPQYKLGDRDFYLALRGKWIIELGEMSNLEGMSHTAIRAALSKKSDNYRAPFDRHANDHPRMSVFASTTNSDQWHNDPHGARRMWPIWCTTIDLAWIADSREQLFAEAMTLLDEGRQWWDVPKDMAKAEVEARRDFDEWEDVIEEYLTGKEWVTLTQVMQFALDLQSPKEQTDVARKRVGKAMRQLSWRKTSRRMDGRAAPKRVWVHSSALERALALKDEPPLGSQSGLDGF